MRRSRCGLQDPGELYPFTCKRGGFFCHIEDAVLARIKLRDCFIYKSADVSFISAGDHVDVHANAVYAALCRDRYRNYKSVSASADVDQRDNAVCASLRRGLYINKKAGSLLNGGCCKAERTESFRFLNSISDIRKAVDGGRRIPSVGMFYIY